MAIGLTVILTGLMLFMAVVILKMNQPHFGSLLLHRRAEPENAHALDGRRSWWSP